MPRSPSAKPTSANRARLEAESDKLLTAHFADAIDLPTLKRHQDRIRAGLADIDRRLAEHDAHHTGGRAFLHDSLRLLTDAHHAYTHSNDGDRRLENQAFYTRLEVTEDEELHPTLAEPFATITEPTMVRAAAKTSLLPGPSYECCLNSFSSGGKGTRTPNPLLAKQVRYQLRHTPWSTGRYYPHEEGRCNRSGL